MRKYTIPKSVYCLIIGILVCLSIGYTYAYFSAIKSATSQATINTVQVYWYNINGGSRMENGKQFGDVGQIQINGKLQRAGYTNITGVDINTADRAINLAMETASDIDIFCRIKLTASYTDAAEKNQPQDCSQYIKLARNGELITEASGAEWTYHNGYYYYGQYNNPTKFSKENSNIKAVANQLYLEASSPADMYGAKVKITLTLEAVQAANNAYQTVWAEI